MNEVFGTDGIRGKTGKFPITAEFFLKLGWAVGKVLTEKYDNPSVIIGKDTRISGYLFESSLEAGLLSSGVDVGLLGPMPTPAIAYLIATYGVSGGAVISASHNSYIDNGVKFFGSGGLKISTKFQMKIEENLQKKMLINANIVGKARRYEQAVGRYIEFCKASFNRKLDLTNLKIIVDCANGATYHIAGSVFRELGATVALINDKPNGKNINHLCGATNAKSLQQAVLKQKANIGIAFDGDGDRVIMVDEFGELVDGDDILFIIAKHYKQQGILTKDCVVGTQMTNFGVRDSFKSLGIRFIEAKVGDKFIMEQMQNNGAILGGEGSGHIICFNHTTTGDGIIASLQVVKTMITNQESLNSLKKVIKKNIQILENIKIKHNFEFNNEKLQQVKMQIEKKLGKDGRVLVRKSGTENLLRIMVEAKTKNSAEKYVKQIIKFIESFS